MDVRETIFFCHMKSLKAIYRHLKNYKKEILILMKTMNELKIFENSEFGEVRTAVVNNEPMFCLADVCKALDISHVTDVKNRLKQDGVATTEVIDTLGRKQMATFINESNLYKTIFQSLKENAEKFTDWVTSEVLPSIRKHGMYAVDELINDPDLAIKAFTALKEERQRNKQLQEENESMRPKADYFDALVDKKLNTNVRDTAKELGVKEKVFVNFLLENGFVYRQGKNGSLRPYAQYCESGGGLFVLKDTQNENSGWAGQQMFITPKGKETFRLLLERETEK